VGERIEPISGGLRQALLLLLLIGSSSSDSLAQYNLGTGDAMTLYRESCAGCHGPSLGGGSAGSLIDDKWINGDSDESIARSIRDGVSGTAMLAWQAALGAKQIRSLVILIREQRESDRLKALEKANTVQAGVVFKSELHAFTLEPVTEMAGILWGLDFLPDGSLLSTQLDGTLWHIVNGKRTAIAGTPNVFAASQGGLLDVKVHSRPADGDWVYLTYSEKSDRGAMTAVVRGKIKDDRWVEQQNIFRVPVEQHIDTTYHYGSRLAIAGDYLFL
jgi:glucose/arabinose dehydrogenase